MNDKQYWNLEKAEKKLCPGCGEWRVALFPNSYCHRCNIERARLKK